VYKLSKLADSDFANIYDYTLLKFGEAQADRYTDALDEFLETLSKMPEMGQDYPRVQDVKRIVFQSHTIFYTAIPSGIFIARILHQQMDTARHLPDF
jgi:toxin ParE1/3/4